MIKLVTARETIWPQRDAAGRQAATAAKKDAAIPLRRDQETLPGERRSPKKRPGLY